MASGSMSTVVTEPCGPTSSRSRSGVTFQLGESITGPELWLATDPDLCWLKATKDAVDRGLVTGTWKMNIVALASGGSLAYRARLRPVDDQGTAYEYGAYGHGPHGAQLIERLVGHIRTWDRDHHAGPRPGPDRPSRRHTGQETFPADTSCASPTPR